MCGNGRAWKCGDPVAALLRIGDWLTRYEGERRRPDDARCYPVAMNKDAKLFDEALKLPPEARAALAAKLIDSLDSELDEDPEERWSAEIERRLAEVDARCVATIPWSEVRASFRPGDLLR